MPTQAQTAGFQGSDTDGLDKIVSKMKEAAAFADKMVMALKALCAALDAMSWTGYAAALSAYLKGTVIPLLQAVSKNLQAFAQVVGLASSVQKDTSSNRYIVDAGDTGYVPTPITGGSGESNTDTTDKTIDDPTKPPEQGAVESKGLDTDKLSTVVDQVSDIIKKALGLAESADGDGDRDGTLGEQIGKLGELVGAIEKLIGGDAAGGDAGTTPDDGTGTTPGDGSTTPGDGTTTPGDGTGTTPGDGTGTTPGDGTGTTPGDGTGTTPGDGTGTTPGDGTGTTPGDGTGTTPGDGTGTTPGDGTQQTFTAGQIWQAVTGALRELGIVGPDGTVGSGAGAGTGTGIDLDAAGSQIDSIQSSLDDLRSTLGIESPTTDAAGSEYAGLGYGTDPGFTPESTYGADVNYGTDLGTPLTDSSYVTPTSDFAAESAPAASMPTPTSDSGQSFPAESSGSGGGSDSGSGGGGSDSGSAGGPSADGTAADQQAPTARTEVVYRAEEVGGHTAAAPVAADGTVQTRLVASTTDSPSGSGSAAIPLTGAALAASVLGGVYARRARSENESEEVFAAEPAATGSST